MAFSMSLIVVKQSDFCEEFPYQEPNSYFKYTDRPLKKSGTWPDFKSLKFNAILESSPQCLN